jgi:hypothetical protein
MRWTTLQQERSQGVLEFTNTFHTLLTKMGIKDSEQHLVLKYREALFHSQKWVKGASLHFIGDRRSQKNLISTEVVKQLGFSTTPHPQPYKIDWLCQG